MLAAAITLNLETIVVILTLLGVIFGWLSKLNAKENELIKRLNNIEHDIIDSVNLSKASLDRHKSENELEFYKLRATILMIKTHQENIEKYLQARSGYTPRNSGYTDASFLGEEDGTTNH